MIKFLVVILIMVSMLSLSGCMTVAGALAEGTYNDLQANKANAAGKGSEDFILRVKRAQTFLGIKVSGKFDGRTRVSITHWQEKNGFPKSGDLDAFLLQANLTTSNPPTATQTPTPKKVKANTELIDVQKSLSEKGYKPGAIDGVYGNKTKAALIEFQKDNGLKETGRVDASTRKLLLN